MKITEQEFIKDIINVSGYLNMSATVNALIQITALPELVKILTHEMFIQNKQQYFVQEDNVFRSIENIRDYCKELQIKGYVTFK